MSLYDVLGVARTALADDISRAYKKKAIALHPDKLGAARTEEEERYFKVVSAAYDVLKDDARRREYDAALSQGAANARSGSWLNFVSV
jgi:molecular chaperone DnaJ